MSNYYESRQHLNLSQLAFDTIENDKFVFQEKPSFAKMLNRVITMYRDYADASIENACIRYKELLEKQVEAIPAGPSKDRMIFVLVESYKAELINKVTSYPREHQFKFQLDRQNYEFIMDWRDTVGAYEGVPGRFLKAVLEEYARKPLIEREAILYRDLIELINACIESHLSLSLTLNNGARYEVRPFGVLTDTGNNYHYLAGFSRKAGLKEDDKPSSFRISNIRDYKLYYGRSGKISEKQKKDLEQRIKTVGVQFLLQEPSRIRIILSKRGKAMYESQAHLRPAFTSREIGVDGNWVFEFNCTQIQAQYYFFKFGSDAEIISPPELRKEFFEQYSKALSLYG